MHSSPDVPDSAVYFCTKCDYKYNPQFGDPVGQIQSRTPFKKLSSDWKCPICGASKSDFTISR
ncbi:MAG: rubredoxin [Planctomycetes bacterium]|nr:rubredoxin [Planctomycetota bacterium]